MILLLIIKHSMTGGNKVYYGQRKNMVNWRLYTYIVFILFIYGVHN